MEMFENIDYLQEVRCNGIVWRWEPAVFDSGNVLECKFTVQVRKKLKAPSKRKDGKFTNYHYTYWKCIVKGYDKHIPIYEIAKKLKVGTPVFVSGDFYFSRYIGKDYQPKYVYGMIVQTIDLPRSFSEDAYMTRLNSHHYPTKRERAKGFYKDKHGEKVILYGGIGKPRITKDDLE
jgi:hypothetical protein